VAVSKRSFKLALVLPDMTLTLRWPFLSKTNYVRIIFLIHEDLKYENVVVVAMRDDEQWQEEEGVKLQSDLY